MNPIAIELGPLQIRWYGVFVALGFLAALTLLVRRAAKSGFGKENAADLALVAMVGGIVGARVLYVLQNLAYFRTRPLIEVVRVDHGGLVFYGGFIGACAAVAVFAKMRKRSPGEIADLAAPVLPLGHAIGRIGCFINGCCFGMPWAGTCAVRYPNVIKAAGRTMESDVFHVQSQKGVLEHGSCAPVFPVQLLATFLNVVICVVLLLVEKRMKRRGQLFGVYMILYAAARFVVEFFRGDYLHSVLGLTPAQVVCLGLAPVGIATFVLAGRWGSPVATRTAEEPS